MGQEVQPNRPLSGTELREIIINDVRDILQQDGMLVKHIAYGNVAYCVTVRIMTANPIIPNWTNKTVSRKSTEQQIAENESLEAVYTFPLSTVEADEPLNIGVERTRQIISPNHSRIENGLPVTITFRGPEGDVKEEDIHYEKELIEEGGGFPDSVVDRELDDAEITKEE